MRGCRGSGFNIGPDPGDRVGRSGRTAKEWGRFGQRIGERMREKLAEGKCDVCRFFGVKVLSPKSQIAFDKCWGEGESTKLAKKKGKKCLLTPEEWVSDCPANKSFKQSVGVC